MFTIDKSEFGAFVCALRKEKGITQKELAARLFVSDKAVSKWETGRSIPDVALLVPLAEILGVTVTELLECRIIENPQPMPAQQVEDIVIKAVSYGEEKEKKMNNLNLLPAFITMVVISAAEIIFMKYNLPDSVAIENVCVMVILATVFGAYFFFFSKEKLPAYYDENRISVYHDGLLKINMRGVRFNNSNWPHIVKSVRIWACGTLLTAPVFTFLMLALFYWLEAAAHITPGRSVSWEYIASIITVIVYPGWLMAAVYLPAKKYE